MSAEHTSSAPHTTQAAALYAELMDMIAKRDAALAERDRLLESVKRHLADKLTLCEERDAALANLDRLRDAARDFLKVLDRHQFSSVALRGKELDELRRLAQ